MERYISGLNDLNLGKKINGGSCSSIYEFEDCKYFKYFVEDYRDLSDDINLEFYDVVRYLSSLKNMPYIVRGEDVFRSTDEFFGYSMPIIQADSFRNISDTVLVDDVLNGFYLLSRDIRVLSDNFVKTEDIGGDNILYNGFMYLLDLDLSLVDKRYVPDELYERTMNSVLCAVRNKLLGESRYDDIVDMGDIDEYFTLLKDVSSEGIGKEVVTISDMRRGYQKVKNIYRS